MLIKSNIQHKLLLSIYLFLVIFAPPIIPKFRVVIGVITAVRILTLKNNLGKIKKCLRDSKIYIWIIGIVIFLLHMFFMLLINEIVYSDTVQFSHYISLYNRFLVSLIEIVPCSIYIITKLNQYGYEPVEFLEIIFGAALVEAMTVMLAIISPTIKGVFNHMTLIVGDGSLIGNRWYITVRSFGFADTLVDTFGWGTGVIAGLALIYGILKKWKYIFLSFLLLVSPLFNARTGVVMYIIAIAVLMIYILFKLDIAKMIKIFFCAAILIFIGTVLWNSVLKYYPATAGWIKEGLYDIIITIANRGMDRNVEGFAMMLQKESWWELPQFPRVIFGTGHSRYGARGYTHSDFGYVNDIWAGGLYGCLVLYSTIVVFTLRSFFNKRIDKCYKIMILYMLITLFVFNIKGCAYGCNSGLVTYVLTVSYFNYYYVSKQQILKKLYFSNL